ncbi:MAG TPA: c-type cytochrome [Candidatus Saccharimonadales bacterium]|nr:c-type cytochrome [Candidatus Saccharimonadales bacterium]
MKQKLLKVLCVLVLVAGTLWPGTQIFAQTAPSSRPADDPARPAEQAFKNIQTLKGVPADQILVTMQFIGNSLGVECEFCHVRGAFEKDDKKEKLTARKMIDMQMAINKDHFKGERAVTCFSCHRGQHDPVAVPAISEQESKPAEAPKPGDAAAPVLPTADQVFDKYLQAMGGAPALQKITTREQKGSINVGARSFPLQVLAKAPNKRATAVTQPNGMSVTAFDGQHGWTGVPGGRPPQDMTRTEAEAFSFDSTFYLPLELRKMFSQTRVRPSDKIDGHDVVQVIGIREGRPPMRLFFDLQSGLLVRMVRYADTPLGRNPTQIDYADYREDSGVRVPFRWTVARPMGRFTIQIEAMQQNIPVDDGKFAKPAAAAPQPAK